MNVGSNRRSTGTALFLTALLTAGLLAGCGSTRSGGGMMDPNTTRSGAPASSEMAQLCDLHRQMAGRTPEQQDAMLETHMQAAHGTANPQSMSLHRQSMLSNCSGR